MDESNNVSTVTTNVPRDNNDVENERYFSTKTTGELLISYFLGKNPFGRSCMEKELKQRGVRANSVEKILEKKLEAIAAKIDRNNRTCKK